MKNKNQTKSCATAFLALALGSQAHAATIMGSTADNSINGTPALRTVTSIDEVVKAGNAASAARNVVFVFQLPTLTVGQSFSSSSLSFTLLQNGDTQVANGGFSASVNPTFNLDLYGLGQRPTATVATGDMYFGATTDGTDATLLQADFITSSTTVGTVSFSGAGLDTYLNAQYAGGVNAGNFVFLRLNPDVAAASEATNNQNYRVSMADNTGTTAYAKIVPKIDFTAVPEPSALALLGVGMAFAAGVRRRG